MEGTTGAQIALGFVLNNPMVSSAVFGTTTMSHLEENVRAVCVETPQEVLEKIRTI